MITSRRSGPIHGSRGLPAAGAACRLLAISRKELCHIVRDRRTLIIAVLLPAGLFFLFGYALTTEIRHIPILLVDGDHSRISRQLASSFDRIRSFRPCSASGVRAANVPGRPAGDGDLPGAIHLMQRDRLSVYIEIPKGLEDELLSETIVPLDIYIDGTEPNTAHVALEDAMKAVAASSRARLEDMLRQSGVSEADIVEPLDYRENVLFNEELSYAKFAVPGLIGIIMMMSAILLTSLSIVREKEEHTLERLGPTPAAAWEFLVGKLLPYTGLVLLQVVFVMLIARFVFGIGTLGSMFELAAALTAFLLTSLSLGILFSTLSRSQEVAMMISFVVALLPAVILSGFIFPVEPMPFLLRCASMLVPLRHFLVIIRGIMIKGTSIDCFTREIGFLCVFSLLFISASALRFRRMLG